MGNLHEYTTVGVAFDRVPDLLRASFDGGAAVVALTVRFGELRVERDVEFHIKSKPGYPGYRLFDVTWAPKGGGPYPSFSGTLTVAEDAIGWSRIEIDGSYRPPFGIAGAAFDAAIGHRLAQGTAAELLAEVKRRLVVPAAAQR